MGVIVVNIVLVTMTGVFEGFAVEVSCSLDDDDGALAWGGTAPAAVEVAWVGAGEGELDVAAEEVGSGVAMGTAELVGVSFSEVVSRDGLGAAVGAVPLGFSGVEEVATLDGAVGDVPSVLDGMVVVADSGVVWDDPSLEEVEVGT